jgi:hypothetical protein
VRCKILEFEFRNGCRVGRKEKPPPPLPAGILSQHAFALAADMQERICHAMLAMRAATDVIIRKIRRKGEGGAPVSRGGCLPATLREASDPTLADRMSAGAASA